MLEVSRLLTDNRLWMKDRDELALDLAFYTNIAEGTLLDMKGRANPGIGYTHPDNPTCEATTVLALRVTEVQY